jgi:hypothetical protein
MANKEDLRRWFPRTPYYEEHAERLLYSFTHVPKMPKGFSCLLVGSWGMEAPFLMEVMGASRVACVRAPDEGLAPHQKLTVEVPGAGSYEVDSVAINAETEFLPGGLRDFDLVLMWEVLEHLCVDPAFMVWQAIKALRTGGTICLSTPNALWHVYTIAQLYGTNALGLKLQLHIPFATHWRLYSPSEVSQLLRSMGCRVQELTTFLDDEAYSWKSRVAHWALQLLRPEWLYPKTSAAGRDAWPAQAPAAHT